MQTARLTLSNHCGPALLAHHDSGGIGWGSKWCFCPRKETGGGGGGYRRGKKVLEGADRIRYTLQGVGVNRWERNVCVERCLGIKHMLYVVCIFVNHISE